MMRLAKDLGRTLEEIMEMSSLEFKLWIAFYNLENKEQKAAMRKMNHGRR